MHAQTNQHIRQPAQGLFILSIAISLHIWSMYEIHLIWLVSYSIGKSIKMDLKREKNERVAEGGRERECGKNNVKERQCIHTEWYH